MLIGFFHIIMLCGRLREAMYVSGGSQSMLVNVHVACECPCSYLRWRSSGNRVVIEAV